MAVKTSRAIGFRLVHIAQNAVSMSLSPGVIQLKKGTGWGGMVYVDIHDGGETARPDSISALDGSGQGTLVDGLTWRYANLNNRAGYMLAYDGSSDINTDRTVTVTYKGVTYSGTLQIRTVSDGLPGLPGPSYRPMRIQEFQEIPIGMTLYTGIEEDDEWTDVVFARNGTSLVYYQVIRKFNKSKVSIETLVTTNFLRRASSYSMIATDLFLASLAIIKNLGCEAIEMKDSAGNVLFQAKNGVVTCNVGNFKNINISGNSTFSGFMFHRKTEITAANYASMSTSVTYETGQTRTELNLMKTGNWIEIKSLPATETFHYTSLPAIRTGQAYTDAYRDYVRQFLGNELYVYNTSGKSISIDTGEQSVEIKDDYACCFRMVMAPETKNDTPLERIKWEYTGPFQY